MTSKFNLLIIPLGNATNLRIETQSLLHYTSIKVKDCEFKEMQMENNVYLENTSLSKSS